MKSKITKLFSIMFIAVLCMTVAGCSLFSFSRGDKGDLPNSSQTGSSVIFEQQNSNRTLYTDYAEVASKVKRAVVAIRMDYTVNGSNNTAFGSGVIVEINSINYIITCHHVVSSGGDITVYIPDENSRNIGDSDYNENYALSGQIIANRTLSAMGEIQLIGGDKDSDIAVLKINDGRKNLNIVSAPIPVEGYSVKYAEKIFTIGNPSGELPMTFMSGNISYVNREVNISGIGEMTLLQHDASINHGSSGGGMFNMYGELIGITNAGRDEFYNLNYAIPFSGQNGFVNIASQLIGSYNSLNNNFGYVTGRWALGITVTSTDSAVQGSYVYVSSVESNSNSAGKLQVNDRILSVKYQKNGSQVSFDASTSSQFAYAVSQMKKHLSASSTNPPTVTITVYRESVGKKVAVQISLTEQFIFMDTGFYN